MGLALRRRTTICLKLPKDFEHKFLNYKRYITNLRKTGHFLLGQIANADETAIYLDIPQNYTLEKKGVKEVLMKTTGCEKLRVTVMLAATADGGQLPPLLVLNRKTTQIRVTSEVHYSQGPGKIMDDGGTDVGVDENRMEL
jgi:hypothetical protein